MLRDSKTLAEGCAGFRGLVDPRPMMPDVLMPLVELSALLPVLTLHSLLSEVQKTYNTQVATHWPGCRTVSMAGYTVGDALAHKVPLDSSRVWRQPGEPLQRSRGVCRVVQ